MRHPGKIVRAALVAAALTSPAGAGEEPTLTLAEARKVALAAALQGNVPVAEEVGARLLQMDPKDGAALMAVSTVHLSRGEFSDAYRMGRRAFRFAPTQTEKYHAARLAAVAALADKRLVHAQFWLRRAGDLAPSPVHRARVERNFRLLRSESPWRYKFSFSATPTDNVNGGSDHAYNIIDGVPYVGTLDAAAMALSGVNVQSSLAWGYRFARTERGQSELTGSVHVKRVMLSEEARAAAPGFDESTLGVTAVSFGVAHTRVLGEGGTVLRFETGLRDTWGAGKRDHTAMTGSVMLSRKFNDALRLTGVVSGEARSYGNGRTGFVGSVQATAAYTFPRVGTLTALVSYMDNDAPNRIFDNTAVVAKLSFALGKPIHGVELSAGVGISHTDFPDYTMIVVPVPGGRQDDSLFFDFDAKFTQLEYAGFSPTLRVRRAVTESNVSRFSTSEWAVSLGIESNF